MKHITLLAAMAVSMGAVAQITDGGFEAGIGAGTWNEASVTFGTPLCNLDACGDCGGPCVAHNGDIYAWFGGSGAATEIGSVDQDVHFPAGSTANITAYVKMALAGDHTTGNYLKLFIDGNQVGIITGVDSASYGDYTVWSVPVNAYANGASHNVKFEGKENGGGTFNILADDIALEVDGQVVAGLFENEALSGIQVYPNPANTTININFNAMKGAAAVNIVDINGQVVASERLGEVSRRLVQYEASGLANGLYTISIEQAGQRFTKRLVISH